jgi:hypothetical protein
VSRCLNKPPIIQEFEAQIILALEPEELGRISLKKINQLSVTDYVRRDSLANDVLQDSRYPQHLRQGLQKRSWRGAGLSTQV